MKENNEEKLTGDEIRSQLCLLKDKEELYSSLSKLSFSVSLSLAAILTILSTIIPFSLIIGLGILGVGILSTCFLNFKSAKCADEIVKLEQKNKSNIEQLAMDEILQETYEPTIVKKSKTKKVVKENDKNLEL